MGFEFFLDNRQAGRWGFRQIKPIFSTPGLPMGFREGNWLLRRVIARFLRALGKDITEDLVDAFDGH